MKNKVVNDFALYRIERDADDGVLELIGYFLAMILICKVNIKCRNISIG